MSDKSQLAIIGGIMINVSGVGSDRFLPLKFEIRKKNSSEDVYQKIFGFTPKKIMHTIN